MAEKNYIAVKVLTLPRARKELALLRKASDTINELLEQEAEEAFKPILARHIVRELSGQQSQEENDPLRLWRLLNQPPEDKRYAEVKFHLPPQVWSSLFLSGYSVLEHYMVSTCDLFNSLFKWRAKPRHLKGQGIGRSKTYLAVIAGVELPTAWSRLTEYNKVRNCIVHSAGNVKHSSKAQWLQKHVESTAGLGTDGLGYLQIERNYLSGFLDTVESFSADLDQSVRSRIEALIQSQEMHNQPRQTEKGR